MTIELVLKSDAYFDFSVGTVTPGKEAWMYGDYFPKIAPVMDEYKLRQLGSFNILATNIGGLTPKTGSFNNWPSLELHDAFHNDPRFLAVQEERDAALDVLIGGNFFEPLDAVIALKTDGDYAVIIAKKNPLDTDVYFEQPFATESPNKTHAGKTITLLPWCDAAEKLLASPASAAEVYKIRMNPAVG